MAEKSATCAQVNPRDPKPIANRMTAAGPGGGWWWGGGVSGGLRRAAVIPCPGARSALLVMSIPSRQLAAHAQALDRLGSRQVHVARRSSLGVSRKADAMTMTNAVSSMWGQVCGEGSRHRHRAAKNGCCPRTLPVRCGQAQGAARRRALRNGGTPCQPGWVGAVQGAQLSWLAHLAEQEHV